MGVNVEVQSEHPELLERSSVATEENQVEQLEIAAERSNIIGDNASLDTAAEDEQRRTSVLGL